MSTVFGAIFVFLTIIALHEFGHFAMAKWAGVRVNEFSIGMGPSVWKQKKGETQYSLRALPIGGFVAMEGEEEASDDPRSFNNASVPARMAIVASGAGMNFILAFLAFFLGILLLGYPTTTIGEVMEDRPAAVAGLMPGDKILAVDGQPAEEWEEIAPLLGADGMERVVTIEREGRALEIKVSPQEEEGRFIIGIVPTMEHHVGRALSDGLKSVFGVLGSIKDALAKIFSGEVSPKQLAGPVGVVQIIGQSAAQGFASLLLITGFISANLGFMNLLPIPALDGGKLLFLIIEGIMGRPISPRIEMALSLVGITLLFGLMIYVTIFGDIARIMQS
ncbi:MAG: RIP metalloprotease RseP [Tissierellia bacterium]|nr:RIP metalloprotease RseP [Tissierellia bacterium]